MAANFSIEKPDIQTSHQSFSQPARGNFYILMEQRVGRGEERRGGKCFMQFYIKVRGGRESVLII